MSSPRVHKIDMGKDGARHTWLVHMWRWAENGHEEDAYELRVGRTRVEGILIMREYG